MKTYTDLDFPQQFERMVTCGSTECMGKRRKENWKVRYEKKHLHLVPV